MEVLFFLGVGLVAGMIGSVLGIGGGLLLVPGLTLLLELPVAEAVAISLISVVANSTTVISRRLDKNLINVPLAITIEPLCFLMGFLGGKLASHLDEETVQMVFSLFCIFIIISMLLKRENSKLILSEGHSVFAMDYQVSEDSTPTKIEPKQPLFLVATTSLAGLLSGVLGIGGGALVVPSLNIIGGLPLKVATGTSSYVIGMSALGGVIAYMLAGKMDFIAATPVLLGVILGARVVEAFFHRIPDTAIRVLFNSVLLIIAWRMWPK